MNNIRIIFFSAALCVLIVFGLVGCNNREYPEASIIPITTGEPNSCDTADQHDIVTLRVITEVSSAYGMNEQVQLAKETFEAANKNVTVEVTILPTDAVERTVALEQLRSQRITGVGPDVYLLPTGKYVDDISGKRVWIQVEPVFSDVTLSMQKGMFADISQYYDADDDLRKETLNQTVMSAGVLMDKRYVLPLRYDAPVIYADLNALDKVGISRENLEGSVTELMDAAIESGDPKTALVASLIPRAEHLFSHAIDYDNHTVLLEEQEVASILEIRKLLEHMRRVLWKQDDFIYPRSLFNTYVNDGYFWCLNGYPMYLDSLRTSMENTAMFAQHGLELTMLPLKSTENTWIASVTYYGAVDSECKNVGLAYEFLRTFLTEDYQWAKNVELAYGNSCLIHNSWPVRTTGSVTPLWSRLQEFFKYCCVPGDKRAELARSFRDETVAPTDEKLPILQMEPDEVVFPLAYKGDLAWDQLVSRALAEDSNIQVLAKEWVSSMEQQLIE